MIGAEEDSELVSQPSNQVETTAMDQHVQAQMETELVEQVLDETKPTQVGCNEDSLSHGHQKESSVRLRMMPKN